MTDPKKKATEIVEMFLQRFLGLCSTKEMEFFESKQCALILCEEMLSYIKETKHFYVWTGDFGDYQEQPNKYDAINYWQQVKQEVEKL